jgi:hypothetical protein
LDLRLVCEPTFNALQTQIMAGDDTKMIEANDLRKRADMNRIKRCVLSLSLFVLLLSAGTGVLSPQEALAQPAWCINKHPDINIDLTCSGLTLQSQKDPYWEDALIWQSREAGNDKGTIGRCGCFLSALSTIMNLVVLPDGGKPLYTVDPGGPNPGAWRPHEEFTPTYLDDYLTFGPPLERSSLPRYWGYFEKDKQDCGTKPAASGLEEAASPSAVIQDGQLHIVGKVKGIRLIEKRDLDTTRVNNSLANGLPVIVGVSLPSGAKHAQIIAGRFKDGKYIVLDPWSQGSYAQPYLPGGAREGEGYTNYDQWKSSIKQVYYVDRVSSHAGVSRSIVAADDPSAFEFLAVNPDGRRTGFDPATQTRLDEDPSVSDTESGDWSDLTGEVPSRDPIKTVEMPDPVDGTYRIQVTGTGDAQAKFYLSTFFGRQETILEEVNQPITEGQLLKYELEYSATGESSVSEVSNFRPEARPQAGAGVVAGEPVAFDGDESFDVDGSVESYEWDFEGGSTVHGSQVSHTYEKPGEYMATLKVTDDKGATDTSTTKIKVAPTETVAPTTTVTFSPEPNAEGWNKDDVTVSLSATDGEDGSGVESITYSASWGQEIPETTVEGDSANLEVKTDGYTTITYQAKDKMDNTEEEKTIQVRLDKTGPRNAVHIPADGAKVSPVSGSLLSLQTIAGTADDPLSGVASVQASFRREVDGRYWDGSGWVEGEQWLKTTVLGATGTASWSASTDLPSEDALPEGSYTVRSRATDRVGNVADSAINTFFIEEGLDTTPVPPPDLAGTKLSEDNAVLSGNCDDFLGTSTVHFEASGLATGPYAGTFTESGTATLGELQSTGRSPLYDIEVDFTILSSAGKVTGTKRFVAGTTSGSGGCVETWSGTKNLSVTARNVSYEAIVETPAGCEYVDRGTSSVQAIDSEIFTTNPFSETYTYDFSPPEPLLGSTCSVDSAAPKLELPADMTEEATSKDGAEVAFTARGTDEDPINPEVTCTPTSGSTFPLGDTTVGCSATDRAGNEARSSFKVTVRDTTPPETVVDLVPGDPTTEDTPSFAFSGSDRVTASADLLFSYKVDDEGWSAYSRDTTATLGGSTSLSQGSHTFYVRAKDEAGNVDADPAWRSFTVEPPNHPPTADAGGPYEAREGGTVEVSASGSDPEDGDLTYEWDLDGDGGFEEPGQNAIFSAVDLDGPSNHTVRLRVTDPVGLSATDEVKVNVGNVAPGVDGITGPSRVLAGKKVSFEGSAIDPSAADTNAGFSWRWSVGADDFSSGPNPFATRFSTCGDHVVSATAEDKDGGISQVVKSDVVSVSEAQFKQPLDEGIYNTVQKGRVVPVKISIGCGASTDLEPAIQLLKGDRAAGDERGSDAVETYSSSAANTTGLMREVDDGYIYNLKVPNAYADGAAVKVGDLFTVRVRPFGDSSEEASMYVVLKIK